MPYSARRCISWVRICTSTGLPAGPDDRRVQRLVEVELGHRDVVLEPALHRLPHRVDRAERGVAVLHRLDDDADADEVLDLVELLALHDHLLVDRPVVLRPAADVGVDVQLGEPGAQLGEHGLEVLLALGRLRGDQLLDLGVALRVQHREREVLELPLHVGDAEPVRERRVDVERLLRDAQLLGLGQRRDRAHVVEPVGELDEQDPDVLRHRHEHLAQRRGLLRLLGVELEPVELGDAVDDRGDVGAELALDVVRRDGGVLDRVVEQGGGDRDVVEAEVGEDQRHPDRVGDVGLTRAADLLAVGSRGHVEGPLDERRCRPCGAARGRRRSAGRPRRRRSGTAPGQHGTPVGANLDAGPLPDGSVVLICATSLQAGRVFPATPSRGGQRRLRRRCWRARGLAAPRDACRGARAAVRPTA